MSVKTGEKIYRYVAGGLGALVLVFVTAMVTHVYANSVNLKEADVRRIVREELETTRVPTREDVRDIVRQETLKVADIKAAIVESFTEVSYQKSAYTLEGKPRLEEIEKRLGAIELIINKHLLSDRPGKS